MNKPLWKRVAALTLWLHLMLPVGVWKLWHDPTLSRSAKWRIFIFLFALPWLVYLTVSIWTVTHALQVAIP